MAGAARWPFAQHDPRDREVAARFEHAAQPLAGSWWRGDQHRGRQCRGRAVLPCAVTGLWESGVAGPAQEQGLGVVEGCVQGGRDDQAGDGHAGEAVRAGEQDGGVGGGHDDLGRAGGLAGQRLGQQAGQDRAGCRGCARAGQPQAAQGSDIDGDLLPVADPQSYHSRLYRNELLRSLQPAGTGQRRACFPGRVAARRSAAMAAGSGGSSGRRLEAAAAAGR